MVKAFLSRWVAIFGAYSTITTDSGAQFQSNLFHSFLYFLSCIRTRTTAYHPAVNGLVERFHRQVKASLRSADKPENWMDHLLPPLLGIRSDLESDIHCSAAEIVFDATVRIPGQMISPTPLVTVEDPTKHLHRLRQFMRTLSSVHTGPSVSESYLEKDLATSPQEYLRCNQVRRPFEPSYDGHFRATQFPPSSPVLKLPLEIRFFTTAQLFHILIDFLTMKRMGSLPLEQKFIVEMRFDAHKYYVFQLNECTKSLFKKALSRKNLLVRNEERAELPSQKMKTENTEVIRRTVQTPTWLSADLVQRIGSNPKLSRWLNSPEKMALLNAIGRNPEDYLKRGGNSEDMAVIRELAVILGEHFTKLADEAENEQKRNTKIKKPLIEEIETPAERELKRKVEEALANEKVKEALQDESVKQIIHCLSSDSDRGQRLAAEASADVKEKLRLLIQFGVLGVQTS
nr:unnamed protein product [Spirometra erinaceieuropaei]